MQNHKQSGRLQADGPDAEVGTVFFITLHPFTDPTGGEGSPLVEASDGNYYGTSQNGLELVFRLTRDGAYSVLAVFPANGMFVPSLGSLLAGNDGSLYGTTLGLSGPGVPDIPGTVFKLTLGGQVTTVAQLEVDPVLQFQGSRRPLLWRDLRQFFPKKGKRLLSADSSRHEGHRKRLRCRMNLFVELANLPHRSVISIFHRPPR